MPRIAKVLQLKPGDDIQVCVSRHRIFGGRMIGDWQWAKLVRIESQDLYFGHGTAGYYKTVHHFRVKWPDETPLDKSYYKDRRTFFDRKDVRVGPTHKTKNMKRGRGTVGGWVPA